MPRSESLEISAKTVAEAVDRGLAQLGLTRQQVEVDVLKEGRRGVFGIGAEPAQVKLTPILPPTPAYPQQDNFEVSDDFHQTVRYKDASEDDAAYVVDDTLKTYAVAYLKGLVDLLGVEAEVNLRIGDDLTDEDELPPIVLDLTGRDLGILIGRRNTTLRSLQYLVRLAVNKRTGNRRPILIDVEAYRVRRRRSLQQLAQQMAAQAINTKRRVVLEAMSAYERRIIHMTLRDNPAVRTKSIGVNDNRKVTIIPT